VQHLNLLQSGITDKGMIHLRNLTELRSLSLWNTQVTDVGAAHLAGLTKLEALRLSLTQVGDRGLIHLRRLSKLRSLELGDDRGPITDAGLAMLADMNELRVLIIRDSQVTATGLGHLRGMRHLRVLRLENSVLDDATLEQLAHFPELEELSVGHWDRAEAALKITDTGAKHVVGLRKLKKLTLHGQVTDATLAGIAELTELRELHLTKTQISSQGVEKLRALPHLESLSLGSLMVKDDAVAALKQLRGLKMLNIKETAISKKGAYELGKAQPKLLLGYNF
jgi:internalin A